MNARKRPSFQRIYAQSVRLFLRDLPDGKMDRKAIHRVRINIKNLRALMAAMESVAGATSEEKKLLALIDRIFRQAGRLRSAQVEDKRLKELAADPDLSYRSHLRSRIKRQRKKLAEELMAFNSDRFSKFSTKLRKHIKPLRNADLQAALARTRDKGLAKVRVLWAKGRNANELHEIRKHLRIVRRTMETQLRLEDSGELKTRLKPVRQLESVIGAWHDKDLLAQSLEKFCNKSNPADSRRLIKIVKQLRADNSIAVARIAEALDALVKTNAGPNV